MTTKRTLLTSAVSLVLCICMLLGTTFAWFTDAVTSSGNIIASGKLDAEMYWSDKLLAADSDEWNNADGTSVFNYKNWEPGYTEIRYVKVSNAGTLNFRWKLSIEAEGKVTDLSDVINVYYVNPVTAELTKEGLKSLTPAGTLTDVLANNRGEAGSLTPDTSVILAIAFHMDELAGNDYQNKSLCDAGFSLKLLATQDIGEADSFGDDYDKDATFPPLNPDAIGTVAIPDGAVDGNGILTVDLEINSTTNDMNAIIPAGVKVADGATELTLTAGGTTRSSNINMNYGQLSRSLDVHIDGVAEDNTVPMEIYLGTVLPVGYYKENVAFYHVEDDVAHAMDLVDSFDAHNQFTYNSETGEVTINIASFSEVTAIVNDGNIWQGERNYDWYTKNPNATEFYISNSNELAGFGAIVGGMAKDENGAYIVNIVDDEGNTIHRDSFAKKTVYLTEDICIGDLTDEDGRDVVFYPIGYYNDEETYEKSNKAISSYFNNFEGTFDGQGHTISDWYQNTWEMKGDHNWYSPEEQRYRDGMGLFGKVYGGTVKNLVVRNFSSDGEITTTGTIAAYADGAHFENIQIYNCNPRVYNIGNGGIVGVVGWYAKEANLKTTFKNITVDNSNKISALWGSWDVSCGGIVGQYYDVSGQTSANNPRNGGIKMDNCDAAAVIDVNNDVCGNYQYYQYRYAGMLIGTVGQDEDPSDVAATDLEFVNCRVRYGDWAEYYYCELVANSQASYTHDYQMSRLTKITSLDEIKSGNNWLKAGNFVYTDENGDKKCCHIVEDSNGNLEEYTHDKAGKEIVDGVEVLVEDKQVVHITFKQLYTGYGWGATPNYGDTKIQEYLYTITYINDGIVLHKTYVTEQMLKDNNFVMPTKNDVAESKAVESMPNGADGKKPTFSYWINAGSNRIDNVETTNVDIILYPSFEKLHTIMFVDYDGNVIHYEFFKEGATSISFIPAVPTIEGGYTGEWSSYDLKNAKSDITVYPIYNADDGIVKLTPVDSDGDGDTDHYVVASVVENDNNVNVKIPAKFNGKPVIEVIGGAFAEFDNITTITIPNSIIYLGADAFADEEIKKTLGWPTIKREQVTIHYQGTKEQWETLMSKSDPEWDRWLGEGSHVFFVDANGNIDQSGYYEYYFVDKDQTGTWWSDPVAGTLAWQWHAHAYGTTSGCSHDHVKTSD